MIKVFFHKSKVPEWIERPPFEMFFMQPVTIVWRWREAVHVAPALPILNGVFKGCIMYAPNPEKLDNLTICGAPTYIWDTWSIFRVWIKNMFGV